MADMKTTAAQVTKAHEEAATVHDQEVTATFCFVDIAGYTALTDSHGERAAADLVDVFSRLVRSAVDSHGTVQELSGDNAFLVFPDPPRAMTAITALYREVAGIRDFPALRTGLHHGPALHRANRYFGSTINMAARTAAQAAGGEILCTTTVAQAITQLDDAVFSVDHLGKVKLKNLPREVDLFRVNLSDVTRQRAIDPVCQMQVDTRTAAARHGFDGRQYWFCSTACRDRFVAHPSDFV